MPEQKVTISHDVAADPQTVWAVLTDLEHAAETLSGVSRVEVLTEGGYAVGTRWRETRTMFGRGATEEMEVTEVSAPTGTTVEAHSSGVAYRSVFTLTPLPSGTRLEMTFSGTQSNPSLVRKLVWAVFGGLGMKASAKMMRGDLEDIARRAEAMHQGA
jgi:carbon monoxide dehydrogenase subunit G